MEGGDFEFMKNVDMNECLKKHPMFHSLTGLGVGFILVALFPTLASNAMMLGVLAVVVGIGAEMFTGQK